MAIAKCNENETAEDELIRATFKGLSAETWCRLFSHSTHKT